MCGERMSVPAPTTPKRRRSRLLRYSLRSLFVTTAGIGVLLVVYVVPAERQRQAVSEIRAMGGNVVYDYEIGLAPEPQGLAQYRVDYVATVNFVNLEKGKTDEDINYASQLKALKSVSFDGALTDNELSLFIGQAEMQTLSLEGTDVTDTGLAHLANMRQLETLYLDNTRIGDDGLATLSRLRSLVNLDLTNTLITDVGMRHLAGMPNLRHLSIARTQITDVGLAELHLCKPLTTLVLADTSVTANGVKRIREMLPDCDVYCPRYPELPWR